MGITNSSVQEYLKDLLPPRDAVLAEIEERAARERIPIVGPAVGRFFQQLALMTGARRIFEMGSAVGYSTIWWAHGAGEGGEVYFTDSSAEKARDAREYARRAGVGDRIRFLTGNSLELIDSVDGDLDIVFCDIDKHEYPAAYGKGAGRVRVGGLFVADNALWSGRVADPNEKDANTEGIREFTRLFYADSRFLTTLLPLWDGILVARRLR